MSAHENKLLACAKKKCEGLSARGRLPKPSATGLPLRIGAICHGAAAQKAFPGVQACC